MQYFLPSNQILGFNTFFFFSPMVLYKGSFLGKKITRSRLTKPLFFVWRPLELLLVWKTLLKRCRSTKKVTQMGVSENSGKFHPQIIPFAHRVFRYFHHPFSGISIFGNTQMRRMGLDYWNLHDFGEKTGHIFWWKWLGSHGARLGNASKPRWVSFTKNIPSLKLTYLLKINPGSLEIPTGNHYF